MSAVAGPEAAAYLSALRDAVEHSVDDADLAARVALLPGGDERLLRFLAGGLALSFQPEWAGGACGTVRFAVETSDGARDLCLEVDEERCRIVPALAEPDAEIRIPILVLLRIAFKQLTGGEAYVDGAVEASGDVVLATSLDSWFDVPTAEAAEAFS